MRGARLNGIQLVATAIRYRQVLPDAIPIARDTDLVITQPAVGHHSGTGERFQVNFWFHLGVSVSYLARQGIFVVHRPLSYDLIFTAA
ncbi:MAG: hypothetical protein QOJ64_1502 [Acidobacteriota bacterium]|jgi:hypothetical protein|nr:hypothetical protein [Acidobacteriota bacterium]